MDKKLHIKQGALLKKVREITNNGSTGWGSKEHDALVTDVIQNLEDQDGKIADLKGAEMIIKAILCPTEKNQSDALHATLKTAGFEQDPSTESVLALLFSTVGFSDYLSKTKDPKTGKPFIKKPVKGRKLATFTALTQENSDEAGVSASPAPQVPEVSAKVEAKIGS